MTVARHPLARTVHTFARRAAPDADLVARFVAGRDEAAFAELVRRHGPAVLAACRRLTRHSHDADDAFQATFLVLAKKAHALDPARPVGAWLRGVAGRAARQAARRRPTAALPELPARASGSDPEAVAEVRAAVAALPAHQRAAVERCELGGASRAAAARALGVPPGTLSSRLALARRALADRLRRRGFGPPLAVPPALLAAAAATASEVSSPTVAELAEAVMRTSWAGWKLAAVGLAATTLGLGMASEPAPRPAAKELDPGRLVVGGPHGPIRLLAPDGTEVGRVTAADARAAGADPPEQLAVGLDIKQKNALVPVPTTVCRPLFHPAGRVRPNGDIPIRTRRGLDLLTPTTPPTVRPLVADAESVVAWSPDGRHAVVVAGDKYRLLDTATGAATTLPVPAGHAVHDWAADGTWLLTEHSDSPDFLSRLFGVRRSFGLRRVGVADGRAEPLAPNGVDGQGARLSPDGRRAAGLSNLGGTRVQVWVLDLATGGRATVAEHTAAAGDSVIVPGLAWSPDGRRLAYPIWHIAGTDKRVTRQLVVCDADGGRPATVPTGPADEPFDLYDWR